MINPCEEIRTQIGELFECSPQGQYLKIRTPFMYPDGDYIDLFVKQTDSDHTITDLGETLRWLQMQSIAPRRTKKQNLLIQDILLTHGIELFKGMLMARPRTGEDFSQALARLAQAALRVADIWFTFRIRPGESVNDEVADFLEERKVPFTRAETITGRSGRTWKVDYHIRFSERSSLICILSTGSRAATKRIVEHVVATWYDLSHLKIASELFQFLSLFDDTLDVWSPEDFKLVEDLSIVSRWSNPDEFYDVLKAA